MCWLYMYNTSCTYNIILTSTWCGVRMLLFVNTQDRNTKTGKDVFNLHVSNLKD